MRRLAPAFCSLVLCCTVILVLGVMPAEAKGKTCLCHIPPGNPDNAHTICVGTPAVPAHLDHGDTLGVCPTISTCEPKACGGSAGNTCADDQFCRRADGACDTGQFCLHQTGTCHFVDAGGFCVAIPTLCPTTVAPVCGCDAITYDNACLAAAVLVSIDHTGPCP